MYLPYFERISIHIFMLSLRFHKLNIHRPITIMTTTLAAPKEFSTKSSNAAESTDQESSPCVPSSLTLHPTKLGGYDFFRHTLKSPRYILAPMVDQSDLPWRALSRHHGAHLCYTPMFHAKLFSDPIGGIKYRAEQWHTNPQDRPLIVQFCANDPDTLLRAAKLVEDSCDAVDLNLGCPQHIARRGHYGSFLQEDWKLIERLISTLHQNLAIPVTAKIRVFPDPEKTVAYARMVEAAGAQIIAVHGRTREQKGHLTGLADWHQIRLVKEAVSVPVVANGNILYFEDLEKCLRETGCDAVMSAEGSLYNPALFDGSYPFTWEAAEEYLDFARRCWPDPGKHLSPIRAHMFKILLPSISKHTDLRSILAKCSSWEEIEELVRTLKIRLIEDKENIGENGMGELDERGFKKLPWWRCQPHFRPELPNNGHHEKKEKSETVIGLRKAVNDTLGSDESVAVPAKRHSSVGLQDEESKRAKEFQEQSNVETAL